jgi:hypothetical protein
VFDVHIGNHRHMNGTHACACSQELCGRTFDRSLIGDASADENVDAYEPCTGGHGNRNGAFAVVAQYVDTQRQSRCFARGGTHHGHCGNGFNHDFSAKKRCIPEVLNDHSIKATARKNVGIAFCTIDNRRKIALKPRCSGQCGKVDYANK